MSHTAIRGSQLASIPSRHLPSPTPIFTEEGWNAGMVPSLFVLSGQGHTCEASASLTVR